MPRSTTQEGALLRIDEPILIFSRLSFDDFPSKISRHTLKYSLQFLVQCKKLHNMLYLTFKITITFTIDTYLLDQL